MRGHIRRRGAKSWELKFDLGRDPLTGKRQIRHVSFKGTKREAEVELRRQLGQVDEGTFIDPHKMTLADWLRQWLDTEAVHNVSPTTLRGYRYMADKHVIPALGKIPLLKLKPVHIQDYYWRKLNEGRHRGTGGLSPQSVRHHDRLLNVALKRARALGLIARNPIEDVTAPRVDEREIEILSDDEAAVLLRAAEGTRLYGPVLLAWATGVRRGELLALRWADIDLKRASMTIRQSLEQTKNGLRLKGPKTKRSRRVITLPSMAVEMLRDHKRHQAEERIALGLGRNENDIVFTDIEGGLWAPDRLSGQFTRLVRRAKLRPIGFHGLRHTHITNLLRSGVHPKIASERAGHSSVATTLDIYSHAVESLQEDAAQRVDMAMRQALQDRAD